MTRLPHESWDVKPRPDLEPYELNTICPVTGHTGELEDHHIWRRSFTALGKEGNEALFWVEVDGEVYPNRVALHPAVHRMITENKAELVLREGAFWYVDMSGFETPLNPQPGPQGVLLRDLREHRAQQDAAYTKGAHHHVKPGDECPVCHRRVPKPKQQPEEARQKRTFSIKVPKYTLDESKTLLEEDGVALLQEDIDIGRELLRRERGWEPDVPAYFVLRAMNAIALLVLRGDSIDNQDG